MKIIVPTVSVRYRKYYCSKKHLLTYKKLDNSKLTDKSFRLDSLKPLSSC
jgi:hypothetical protein